MRCWILATGIKLNVAPNRVGIFITACPPVIRRYFFPVYGLKKWRYDLEYKVSSDYALAAKMYKAGYAFKKLNGLVSEFSMGGVSTTNNMELCADAKKVQRQILHVPGLLGRIILAFTPTYYLKDESLI